MPDLSGYKAKVVAGLIRSPEEVAHSLRGLGVDVVTVEQIPLEMYMVLIDAKTKSIVDRGDLEKIADDPNNAYYRTVGGKLPIEKETTIEGLTYVE